MLLYYHRAKVQKLSHLCSAFKNNSYLCGMNDIELIKNKIYEIRGQRVMLDFDLAQAYGVDTAQLKRQVRRNMERFEGEDFMFELTQEELSRCQIGIMNKGRGYNIKYLPFSQLDAISTALVELQTERSQKQRRPIGFNAPQD